VIIFNLIGVKIYAIKNKNKTKKEKNMKKIAKKLLCLVLVLMMAMPIIVLPASAEDAEITPASIKHVKMFAKYDDDWDLHVSYGSVAGMIDGDPYDESADGRSARPYYESDAISAANTRLFVDSEMCLYYGYAVFELNGTSELDDVTIWIAGNGYTADQAARWSNPASSWGINDGYEILVSTDGETWTALKEFSEMCGDGTNAGANFPAEGDDAYASKTVDGFLRVGHKIDLRDGEGQGVTAKYFAIAVTAPSKDGCIDIGEVTVNGTVVTPDAVEMTPSELYAEAENGELLKAINFNDTSWSDDYADHNNWNSYVYVSASGRSLKQEIHNTSKSVFGAKNGRAMWGGLVSAERFSLANGETYTVTFDARFEDGKTGVGIQVDNSKTVLVASDGLTYLYSWNTKNTTGTVNWIDKAANGYDEMNSFAVEIDPDTGTDPEDGTVTGTMTLYVKNAEGTYVEVETYSGISFNDELSCRVYARKVSGVSWNEISDILIYKGLVNDIETGTVDRAAEYDNAEVGDLLNTVDFNSLEWLGYFATDSNRGADVVVSKDGSSARLAVLGSSSKRAMWGGLKSAYPLMEVVGTAEDPDDPSATIDVYGNYRKYTVIFDADFGSTTGGKTLVGIQVDGSYTITVDGNGNTKLWDWNTELSSSDAEKYPTEQWDYDGLWSPKEGTQKFAVEVDPENGVMSLYIVDLDGTFNEVARYEELSFGTELSCRIYTRSYTTGSDVWTYVSNVQIYKGLPISVKEDRAAEYANANEGDLLHTVNFADRFNWHQGFYDSNNNGAEAVISEDGSSARITLIDGKAYNRAIWGGLDSGYPLREVLNPDEVEAGAAPVYKNNNYTLVFDLEFGNTAYNKYGLGIQVDGNQTLVIDGFGCNSLWEWNTQKVEKSDEGEDKWNYSTDVAKAEKHTFAVEVDPEYNTLTLYVMDADGSFNKVRAMTYEGSALKDTLKCRIYTRKLSGTSDADSWTEVSDVKIYKGLKFGKVLNVSGASVRLSVPTGIRFKSEFSKPVIDSLRETYGEDNVKLGMIITPTDYLTNNGVDFEMAALDACGAITGAKYVRIDATTIHEDEDPASYTINCALVNVKAGNYNREFSARAFIEVNGEIYKYADFDLESNSRSIDEVARAAYGDVSTESNEKYNNSVVIAGTTVYSPYDADELKTLTGFFTPADGENEEKQSYINVLSYNLEYKGDDVWEGRNPANAVQTILDANPDVVGIQEDTEDWNDYLAVLKNNGYANLAGNRQYNKYTNKFGNGWAFNDIYYKTEKFTLVSSGWDSFKNLADDYTIEGYEGTDMSIDVQGDAEGWFSDEDIGRTFSYAVLKDKTTGEVILFVNTHLHYGDGTSSSDSECDDDHLLREYQSRLLAAWLAEKAAQYPTQILTGDMNADVSSAKGKVVLNGYSDSGLSFARDEALIAGDTGGTLDGTDYTVRNKYVFDHVIYRNAEALEYTVINNKVDEVDGVMRYPSDHLPVYAKFVY